MADVTEKYGEDKSGNSRVVASVVTFNSARFASSVNHELRWNMDNRVSVAGAGYVNPSFDRVYVLGTGVIAYTDNFPLTISKIEVGSDSSSSSSSSSGEVQSGDVRYVRYAGSDWKRG